MLEKWGSPTELGIIPWDKPSYPFPAVTLQRIFLLRLGFTPEGPPPRVWGSKEMYSGDETLRDLSFRKACISNAWDSLHIWQIVPMTQLQPIFYLVLQVNKSVLHERRWPEDIQQLIEFKETKEWKKQRRFQYYRFLSKAVVTTKGLKNVTCIPFLCVKMLILKESSSHINHKEVHQSRTTIRETFVLVNLIIGENHTFDQIY